MKNIAFIFALLFNPCFSQDAALKKKLLTYFENIPVYEDLDSIMFFLKSSAPDYIVYPHFGKDSGLLEEFDAYHYHYSGADTTDTHIYYRGEWQERKNDSSSWQAGIIGVSIAGNSTRSGRKEYRKLKKEFKGHFQKSTSRFLHNSFVGSYGRETEFYLKKEDKYPFMIIDWHNGAHLTGPGSSIDLYKD